MYVSYPSKHMDFSQVKPWISGNSSQEVKLHATDAKELGTAHERLTELDRRPVDPPCGGLPWAPSGSEVGGQLGTSYGGHGAM